jgi:hypothetical protein
MRSRQDDYLDRRIAFTADYVAKEGVDAYVGQLIFRDVQGCFDLARDRQDYGEVSFTARCATLLMILPKIRACLEGKALEDCGALEGVLVDISSKAQRDRARRTRSGRKGPENG